MALPGPPQPPSLPPFSERKWGDVPKGRVGLEQGASMPPKRSTPKTLHRAGELRKEATPPAPPIFRRKMGGMSAGQGGLVTRSNS